MSQDINALNHAPGTRFSDMHAGAKLSYIGKVIVFVATFGFAFPTLFSE